MRNLFNNKPASTPAPAKAPAKKQDFLDLLLKMSHTERAAVMAELNKGNKMVDNVQAVYDRNSDGKMKSTLLFMC